MRLHILPDEKIINRCIESFEAVFPSENKFVVITEPNETPKHVVDHKNVFFYAYNTKEFWSQIGNVEQYSAVIIHFLFGCHIDFVNKINHPTIYWIEWGADLYKSLLRPKGYKLYADDSIIWQTQSRYKNRWIFELHEFIAMKKLQKNTLRAAKKAKYFVPDSMYDEYPLLLQYYPELKHLEHRDFFYYPIDQILGEQLQNTYCKGNNIIVGNSASATNNHEYVFDRLKSVGVGQRNIIVPLSYGGNGKKYADRIEKIGLELFGNGFKSIRDYMPLNDYNELLLSANVFVYGNFRQEAVGNILIALYIGGKVFLDSRNPLLPFYKSLGLVLYSLDELCKEELQTELPKQIVENNRAILLERYSIERQRSLIKSNF